MGFLVRAVKTGYFRTENPRFGMERKYAGDIFEVEEHEFSDAHAPETKGKINHQGWMERVSDYPEPSFQFADDEVRPQTFREAALVKPVTDGVPEMHKPVRRRPGRPRKEESTEAVKG